MTVILHLSDTHFGTEVPEVMQAVLAAAHQLQPDVITITGDITQRARPREFLAAADFINQLPACPYLIIPGNHDLPLLNIAARLFSPYGNYHRAFGLREGVWYPSAAGKLAIIGFDTTSMWRHTRGRLPAGHLQRKVLRARQQMAPDGLLIACVHQPLVTALQEDQNETLLKASNTAHWLAYLGVDLLLSGHVHMPLIDTTASAFPRLARQFILSGAGTATSRRTRSGAPNAFNVIRVTEDTAGPTKPLVSISLHNFDAVSRCFVAQLTQHFTRLHGSWAILPGSEQGGCS